MPRLPSSLKWLVDRRARVDGEIRKIEKSLKQCQTLAADLAALKELLASVDKTLGLHDIRIEPERIPPIRSQEVRVTLPYGELARSILLCLRLNSGRPVSSREITDFIAIRNAELNAHPIPRAQLSESVGNRLNGLHRSGLIVRHPSETTTSPGLWSIARISDVIPSTQSRVDAPAHSPETPSKDRTETLDASVRPV